MRVISARLAPLPPSRAFMPPWPSADYVLDIVEATRVRGDIVLGASTRAAIGLYRAAQALALLDGRDYVVPDDVKGLAVQALAHRLIGKAGGVGAPTQATADAVREILREIPAPT